MKCLVEEQVRSKKRLIQLLSSPNFSKPNSFRRVIDFVHHSPISMPPSPPPLYIPENQTNIIPCLLEDTRAHVRVDNIFDLTVERLNVILNFLGTTLNNNI